MEFAERLLMTIKDISDLFIDGVIVIGSEAPNLFSFYEKSPVIVSKDIDLGVDVKAHNGLKEKITGLQTFKISEDEPSVLTPLGPQLEVNIVGIDRRLTDISESYVLEDSRLPMMVLGNLSLIEPGQVINIAGINVPMPKKAGLLLEKLLTERSGIKGERDLLVALALLLIINEQEKTEFLMSYGKLDPELRQQILTNLTLLSALPPHHAMPDPRPCRQMIFEFIQRIEKV